MRVDLRRCTIAAFAALTVSGLHSASAQRAPSPLIGRWDLTIKSGDTERPSWLGVELSGTSTLVGRFVSTGGSARPISEIHFENGAFDFELPKQWESGPQKLRIEGKVEGDKLTGRIRDDRGNWSDFTGARAPALLTTTEPKWGKPIELFNGRDLSGWKPGFAGRKNGWTVENGVLWNKQPGNNLITDQKFGDFKIHAEFRYPKGSNGGLYLRGRYEIQIQDDYGKEPDSHDISGIYGFLTPRINAAKPAGEWQTLDVTLVGRIVTIVLNGEPVIERQPIPGITGGALDSREGEPGPIYLQGDHGQVEFRKLTLTPPR
jgi:hypothetical protein